jgi:hypothetical protein
MDALKVNEKGETTEVNERLYRRSNSSYYTPPNGAWLKGILIKVRDLHKPAIFNSADFKMLTTNSLHNKILQGWNWLIDHGNEPWIKELRKLCSVKREQGRVSIIFKESRHEIGMPKFDEETQSSDIFNLEADLATFLSTASAGDVFLRGNLNLGDGLQLKFRDLLATTFGANGDSFRYIVTSSMIKVMKEI